MVQRTRPGPDGRFPIYLVKTDEADSDLPGPDQDPPDDDLDDDSRLLTEPPGGDEPDGKQDDEPENLPAVPGETAPATIEGKVVQPWQRQPEFRPVFPAWVIDPAERRSAGAWMVAYVRHRTMYHLVRAPFYVIKFVAYAPNGVWKAGRDLARWVFDAEAAPLRKHAVGTNDAATYMQLNGMRNDRVRLRLIVSGSVAGTAALAVRILTAKPVVPHWGWYGLAAAATVAAGLHGRQKGRPFIQPAVVLAGPRKLTPDMLFRAYLAQKLCTEDTPIIIMYGPTREAGGWLVIIELPFEYTADQAIKKKVGLAAALRVDEVQLFLDRVRGPGGHAGLVENWVADADPYATPPPVTPLLEVEAVDFWQPMPFGIDARRRPVELSLIWSSLLVGSIPRMGKTFAARLPAAAGALDVFLREIVFDGKGGRDWKPFALVAYRYGSGVRRAVVEHLAQVLAECVEDMNDRYERLQTLPDDVCPEGKLTPALAKNRRMNMPLTGIFIDEVHRYLEDDDYGQAIGDSLTELVKVGPAVGYITVLATQKPDSKAIPAKLRDAMGTRFALKTMTWQASETILGTGTSKAGINAANFLRSHKGVGILLGADDTEQGDGEAQTVRTHLADGLVIAKICERARQLRLDAGTLEGAAAGEELITEKPVAHLLDDILAVFHGGEKQLHSAVICERLAEANPGAYDGWDPTILATALRPHGVETRQTWMKVPEGENPNRMGVTRQQILDALAARV
jgi:DNA segregation ATPase FtsK/SpoIIIE, S-DNA-T family